MKSVGETLKETRESKNYTLEEISNVLKIRVSMLEALEIGDFSIFSSDLHQKSFLRAYAEFLGVNEDKILALYRRERQIKFHEGKKKSETRGKNKLSLNLSEWINIKTLIAFISLLVVFFIILFFYLKLKEFNSPPTLEILTPVSNEILKNENFTIEGFTGDPSIKVVLDGTEANYVNSEGKFRVSAKFNDVGTKRFILVASNQLGRKTEKSIDLIYNPDFQTNAKNKIRIKNNDSTALSIEIIKDLQSTSETVNIQPQTIIEIIYDSIVGISNFNPTRMEVFLNDEVSPTSIDSTQFSIKIENGRTVITQRND